MNEHSTFFLFIQVTKLIGIILEDYLTYYDSLIFIKMKHINSLE
jgi:hypothetical protein